MSAPTKFMVLGILAHRCVLWPFAQPRDRKDRVLTDRSALITAISTTTRTLMRAAVAAEHGSETTDALLVLSGLVEPRGPSAHSEFTAVWPRLPLADRNWIVDHLEEYTHSAATALANGAIPADAVKVWSEVPFLVIDGLFGVDNGTVKNDLRADLICYRPDGDIDVIDLKFGTTTPADWALERDTESIKRYTEALRARLDSSARVVQSTLLYVGTKSASRKAIEFDRRNSAIFNRPDRDFHLPIESPAGVQLLVT